MERMELNPVTESYIVRHDNFDRKEVFEEAFDEIIRNEFRDLVFICEDEKVSYHSEIVSSVSPVIRDFVQKSKSCACSSFVKNQVELFISLDGIHSDVVEMVMSCVYGRKPMMISRSDLSEVSAIFKMFGIDGKAFNIENLTKFGVKENSHKPVNTFKRKVVSDHEHFQKRIKSSEESEQLNQVDYNDQVKKPLLDRRAETIFKEHKSITMTKVEVKPESNVERSAANPPPQHPSNPTLPPNSQIQMFLPHLTVTSVKQDNLDNRKVEETNAEAAQDFEDQEPTFQDNGSDEFGESLPIAETEIAESSDLQNELKCPLAFCTSGKTFRVRCEIMLHLAHVHYTDQLLELHPFIRGGSCQLCVDQQKPKIYAASTKKAFVMHVGVTHEVVMDLLPLELRDILSAMATKGRRKKRVAQETKPLPRSFMDSGDISFSDASFSDNSFAGPSESEPAYDGYGQNYDENSYQEVQEPYQDPYQTETEPYTDPYQESTEMYENPYQEATEPLENPVTRPYEGSLLSESTEAFQEADNYEEADIQQGQSETYNPVQTERQGGNFLASSQLKGSQIKQEGPFEKKDEDHLTCHLCTMRSFPKQDDLLFHLTFSHFSKDLLQIHPFIESKECELCTTDEEPSISTSMSSHLRHMGVRHREVLRFVTPDVAEQLKLEEPVPQIASEIDVTKCKEETEEIKSEVPEAVVEPQETTSVQCSLCTNKVRIYTKRSDFLKHLSLGHFGRNILQVHPYKEGENCSVCQESSSKVFVPTKKEIHVCHLGVLHGKVFDYLSEDLLEMVKSLPTLKKATVVKETPVENATENATPVDATLQEEVAK
eukprot:GFUD01035228.1.p1 GENE.GFUD01035228.1~~GFUD01035228.1.p1  ORF type:complete len:827 (+),score=183.16 GFUD01035228.1:60-2540(+)